jgi:hypothetical protein
MWEQFVTTERFDAASRATLDLIFSADKSQVYIYKSMIRDEGEFTATFRPLVNRAVKLCTHGVSTTRAAVRKSDFLAQAATSCKYTCATPSERDFMNRVAKTARCVKTRCELATAARLGTGLMRWKAKSVERMYSPGGKGYESAAQHFTSCLHE